MNSITAIANARLPRWLLGDAWPSQAGQPALAALTIAEGKVTSVTPMAMKKRADLVTDGNKADAIVANAPATDRNFFQVPKVVE